jgi:hypothetical protein
VGQQGDQPAKKKARDRTSFWAGMLMGAATATGGFFAIKALERVFKKKKEGQPALNPGEAAQRLMVSATGGAVGAVPLPGATPVKPPVVKRTVIEEMVEEMDE